MNTTDNRTLCCSTTCEKRFECKNSDINNIGIHYVEDFSSFGSGTFTDNSCEIEHYCGKLGNYKMFEPITKTNGDQFRSMDDRAIIKWMITNLETDTICNFCTPTMRTENKCDGHCISGILKWLQQPTNNA